MEIKKTKTNYISIVHEEIERYKSTCKIEELPLIIEDDRKGNVTITYSLRINGVKVKATAENKKEAKRKCYKKIFKEQLHLVAASEETPTDTPKED